MPVFLDPSESRSGTRLPDSVIRAGTVVPGLEGATGADLLISPISHPRLDFIIESLPSKLALKKHCEVGLLVQRKTGRDLVSSIPNLSGILDRMLRWTNKPWLLFIGDLKCDGNGNAVIDGHETGFGYNAVQGALESWQLRGGFVSFISRDSLIAPWINRWLEKLRELQKEPIKIVSTRKPQQLLVGLENKTARRLSTLTSFPEISEVRAKEILANCGSLAYSLMFLSDPGGVKIPGVGPKTLMLAKEHLFGEETGLRLVVESLED